MVEGLLSRVQLVDTALIIIVAFLCIGVEQIKIRFFISFVGGRQASLGVGLDLSKPIKESLAQLCWVL